MNALDQASKLAQNLADFVSNSGENLAIPATIFHCSQDPTITKKYYDIFESALGDAFTSCVPKICDMPYYHSNRNGSFAIPQTLAISKKCWQLFVDRLQIRVNIDIRNLPEHGDQPRNQAILANLPLDKVSEIEKAFSAQKNSFQGQRKRPVENDPEDAPASRRPHNASSNLLPPPELTEEQMKSVEDIEIMQQSQGGPSPLRFFPIGDGKFISFAPQMTPDYHKFVDQTLKRIECAKVYGCTSQEWQNLIQLHTEITRQFAKNIFPNQSGSQSQVTSNRHSSETQMASAGSSSSHQTGFRAPLPREQNRFEDSGSDSSLSD